MVADLAAELEIRRPVRVVHSPTVSTPMAWGILRPALLLPANAVSWSADRRRAVVLHELAHVKRRDCLIHVLAQAARAVHWFNPLAWVGTRRLRAERERACDDLVLNSGDISPMRLEGRRAHNLDAGLSRSAVLLEKFRMV